MNHNQNSSNLLLAAEANSARDANTFFSCARYSQRFVEFFVHLQFCSIKDLLDSIIEIVKFQDLPMKQSVRLMGRIVKTVYNSTGHYEAEQVNLACDYLNKNGVIAIPTDTIYGLAAKINDSEALDRIYTIKKRDLSKPLSVCLSGSHEIELISDQKLPSQIINGLLPGPVTILLTRKANLNKDLNPGIDSIGIRVPDHNFVRAIVEKAGPLALTSANISGESSPILIEEFSELWPQLDCIFDCGLLQKHNPDDNPSMQRLGSTVIDLTKPQQYEIIREGCSLNRTVNILRRFGLKNSSKIKR